jgi:uncharacterized protein YbjQ (UPF0145 family)
MLSTRETFSRAFEEFGLVVGEGETVREACDNLTANARTAGADAVIALRMLSRQNPLALTVYGTLIRWVAA